MAKKTLLLKYHINILGLTVYHKKIKLKFKDVHISDEKQLSNPNLKSPKSVPLGLVWQHSSVQEDQLFEGLSSGIIAHWDEKYYFETISHLEKKNCSEVISNWDEMCHCGLIAPWDEQHYFEVISHQSAGVLSFQTVELLTQCAVHFWWQVYLKY